MVDQEEVKEEEEEARWAIKWDSVKVVLLLIKLEALLDDGQLLLLLWSICSANHQSSSVTSWG